MVSDSIAAVSLINPLDNAIPRSELQGVYAKEGAVSRQIGKASSTTSNARNQSGPNDLTEPEKREVQRLKQRDAEVKNHERAHIASGGPYVRGGANFQYQRGPDGRNYAVGGEVTIDASSVPNNPDATIRKMQVVRRAALAPADPSPQDRSVATRATQLESQARTEKRQLEQEESQKDGSAVAPETSSKSFSTQRNAVNGYSSQQQRLPSGSFINVLG